MAEPSKEALGLANSLWDSGSRDAIAAALQKLMDERDAECDKLAKQSLAWQERAEAAEEREAHFACLAKAAQLRAEAAEDLVTVWTERARTAQTALARLKGGR